MWSPLKKITGYTLQVAGRILLATCNLQLATLFFLTACGFQPMYGDNSVFTQNTPLAGNLIIDPIGGREGQIFKIALEDQLNPEGITSARPEYRLHVSFAKTLVPTVIKSDGTIQRYDVKFISHFILTKSATSTVLLSGDMTRIGSYNVTVNANFATYEAEQDVIERTLQELAQDYVLRLAGYFAKDDKNNQP